MNKQRANYYTFPGVGIRPLTDLPQYIIGHVCQFYNLTDDQIKLRNRKREIVIPRQIAMYLIKKYTKSSLMVIGRHFELNHATVLHAIKTVKQLAQYDRKFKEVLAAVEYSITHTTKDSFQMMVKRASQIFKIPTIQILEPKRVTGKTYRVRSAIITAHQFKHKTSTKRLAELLNEIEPNIKIALNDCVRFQSKDSTFHSKVLELKG